MRTIVYLHGFVSAPQSHKATVLGDYVRGCVTGVEYIVPALHHSPARALAQVEETCRRIPVAELTLVGSSLGGFYATVIAERLGCRAVLLNPAVHPQAHADLLLGPRRNLFTGEEFVFTREHVEALRVAEPPAITRPERYWLIAETGDEVLDYRDAVRYYAGACQIVVQGGNHALTSFPEHVPDIVDWAANPDAAAA